MVAATPDRDFGFASSPGGMLQECRTVFLHISQKVAPLFIQTGASVPGWAFHPGDK
jgi:hypothetical protein